MTPSKPSAYLKHIRRELTREDINQLPLRRYEGKVLVAKRPKELDQALQRLAGEPVLGFDTETRPSFRKGVVHPPPALIQLAGRDVVCLFQLNRLGLPDPLLEVLGDAGLVKTGVALRDDVRELWRIREFAPAGFLDLSETAGRLQLRTNGLRNLAANLLGFRISKRAQCSNWARRELTPKQIVYAATDAWISRELYIHLRSHGLISNEDFINLDPNPEGERGGEAQN